MNDDRFTTRIIKFAFIFIGSVGTILFLRWIIRPMLPIDSIDPGAVETALNFALGLLGFALIVAAAASGVAIVSCVMQSLRDRSKGS